MEFVTDLLTFSIDDLPVEKYTKLLTAQLDWSTTVKQAKHRYVEFEFIPNYSPDKVKSMTVKFDIDRFIPQIQVFDKGVVVRNEIIRAHGLVWKKTGELGKSHMLVLLSACTGSLRNVLERMGCTVNADFPDLVMNLETEVKAPDWLQPALKTLKKQLKSIDYEDEWIFWLHMFGSGGRKVHAGLDRLLRIIAYWALDIHEEKSGTFVDDIIYKWKMACEIGETSLWQKRLRLIEHCLWGIRERLVDLLLKTSGKQEVTVNLAEFWYKSGLFVYNTASNLLGLRSLRTRTTLRGLGGFKELPFELRLLSEELVELRLCPIDTGDRENAGAVHFYTDTVLVERTYSSSSFIDTIRKEFPDSDRIGKLKSFCQSLIPLLKQFKGV